MGYKFCNPDGIYFVSFAVVHWVQVFTKDTYCQIIIDNLKYCQSKKGMEIISWCIMPDHMHMIFRSRTNQPPGYLLGDFKRFTSRNLIHAINSNIEERNKDVWMSIFRNKGRKTSNTTTHQFWRHDNHPIELWSNGMIQQKINYIHNNPVAAGLVANQEDYLYSSARDYAGEEGLISNLSKLEYL